MDFELGLDWNRQESRRMPTRAWIKRLLKEKISLYSGDGHLVGQGESLITLLIRTLDWLQELYPDTERQDHLELLCEMSVTQLTRGQIFRHLRVDCYCTMNIVILDAPVESLGPCPYCWDWKNEQSVPEAMKLQVAAHIGDYDLARHVLQHSDALDMQGKIFPHALLIATYMRWGSLVELLLSHGADPAVHDEDGRTALHWAARYGDVEIMTDLLQHGASVDVRMDGYPGHEAFRPMHFAALRGHEAAVRLLLAQDDAYNDEVRFNSVSPLSLAVVQEHENVVRALLEADLIPPFPEYYPDAHFLMPLLLAQEVDNHDLVQLLLQHARELAELDFDPSIPGRINRNLLERLERYMSGEYIMCDLLEFLPSWIIANNMLT